MRSSYEPGNMRVLVIGSGPIIIGQSAEFDYAGTQACKILKSLGIYTVLLNSNPATIQTDSKLADKIFIEPITPKNARRIIMEESINYIIGSMGGQTALNLVLDLYDSGFLEENNVCILGTQPENIRLAEDRDKFHELMDDNGILIPWSLTLNSDNWMQQINKIKSYPVIVRTSFSLGGASGKILDCEEKAMEYFDEIFSSGGGKDLEIEESLLGMTEMEYEIIRDSYGNSIMVCNMENLDPMGVHTGESIVITPSLTIPDNLHQRMRKEALRIADILHIIGACNVQFSIDSKSQKFYVIEINPRTSRSSALASKASGYPIAKIATRVLLGQNLTEIKNPITGNTSACFEPTMDYVTVKIPLWPDEKFKENSTLGISMKSTGEAMGIGKNFEEAFLKAITATEKDYSNFFKSSISYGEDKLRTPNWERLPISLGELFNGKTVDYVCKLTGWNIRIIQRIKNLVDLTKEKIKNLNEINLRELKDAGVTDRFIQWMSGVSEVELLEKRERFGILPTIRMIDSSSAEFQSSTKYLYQTYGEENEGLENIRNSVLIIGAGPNRIGQGVEFDYSSVKAIESLKSMNYSSIMINSNPETVSTDFDVSDELFFDPVSLEYVSGIIESRKPEKIILQFSGQTGQNMAKKISSFYGEKIIGGTSSEYIEKIENRNQFSNLLKEMNLKQAKYFECNSWQEVEESCFNFHYNVIIRGSFVIGGSFMKIIKSREELDLFIEQNSQVVSNNYLNLQVSEFIKEAKEYDVDFIGNGKDFNIMGIMEQIEFAGIHSGDSVAIIGEDIPHKKIEEKIKEIVGFLVLHYEIKGFGNLQIMEKDGEVYVIELNSRSSRTVPFISKFTGIDMVQMGMEAIMEGKISSQSIKTKGYAAKIPVFPFDRFPESKYELGVEMRSTGEAMVIGSTIEELKGKIRDFLKIENQDILIFSRDFIHFKKEKERVHIKEEEALLLLKNSKNIMIVCCQDYEKKNLVGKIASNKKIPLILDRELATYLDIIS
jgi:carbamoyl-phosphate synthase large subunit